MRDGTKGMIALAAGAGALALAVGAWLAPSSFFQPGDATEGESRGFNPLTDIPTTRTETEPTTPETEPRLAEWDALAAKLEQFRPEVPVVEQVPDEPDGPDGPDGPAPEWQPNWVYEGYVGTEEGPAALVRIAGIQHFVFEGDEVTDPNFGPSRRVVVESIDLSEIRLSLEGMVGVVERTQTPLGMPGSPQPGGVQNPGMMSRRPGGTT